MPRSAHSGTRLYHAFAQHTRVLQFVRYGLYLFLTTANSYHKKSFEPTFQKKIISNQLFEKREN